MKKCPKCNVDKDESMFHKDKSQKSGLCCYCKECSCKKESNRYSEDVINQREYRKALNIKNNDLKRSYVFNYLAEHPCIDCGESDPIVLEFDHILGKKAGTISNMITNNGLEKIKEEIKKCVVRCANCHRRKTAVDFKYYGRLIGIGPELDC